MHPLKRSRFTPSRQLAALLACCGMSLASGAMAAPQCEVSQPVRFGGMSWESNLLMVGIERTILEKGYGCKTQVQPGETLTIFAGAQRGDVDVISEVWQNSARDVWDKTVASGRVKSVGEIYQGYEHWYVPRYTAERLKGLKSVSDLPKFASKFADPEDPGKGVFYGCPIGWACDLTARNLFNGYKLGGTFNYSSPGTAAAQKAAIMSAYKRKRNIVFYYWGPTPLLGKMDLVQLDMGPYNAKAYSCVTSKECAHPSPTNYPLNPVLTAVNTKFAQRAPNIVAFLGNIKVSTDHLNETMNWADQHDAEMPETVAHYLKKYPDVWTKWVPADVAQRVKQGL